MVLFLILPHFVFNWLWCRYGLNKLVGQRADFFSTIKAIGFGLVGIFMGLLFGGLVISAMQPPKGSWPLVFFVLIPVAWIKWAILAWIIVGFKETTYMADWQPLSRFMIPKNPLVFKWVFGGTLISCLGNAVMIFSIFPGLGGIGH